MVKTYDGKANAVDGVTIDIARGEFITFLGPSGSGKTTTLMMIAGFEWPTSGVIEVMGTTFARVSHTSATSAWCFRAMRCFRI